jgi:hypothetical protein
MSDPHNPHDYGLSAEQLQAKYGEEHPTYTQAHFGAHRDYWPWVVNSLHYEEHCWAEAYPFKGESK